MGTSGSLPKTYIEQLQLLYMADHSLNCKTPPHTREVFCICILVFIFSWIIVSVFQFWTRYSVNTLYFPTVSLVVPRSHLLLNLCFFIFSVQLLGYLIAQLFCIFLSQVTLPSLLLLTIFSNSVILAFYLYSFLPSAFSFFVTS